MIDCWMLDCLCRNEEVREDEANLLEEEVFLRRDFGHAGRGLWQGDSVRQGPVPICYGLVTAGWIKWDVVLACHEVPNVVPVGVGPRGGPIFLVSTATALSEQLVSG